MGSGSPEHLPRTTLPIFTFKFLLKLSLLITKVMTTAVAETLVT